MVSKHVKPVDLGHSLLLEDLARGASACGAGRLHFVKFETAKVHQAIDFIEEKGLHRCISMNSGSGRSSADSCGASDSGNTVGRIKATGGGAFKFSELFEVGR